MAAAIQRAVREHDPSIPAYEMKTMSDWLDTTVSPRRFIMLLIVAFGALSFVRERQLGIVDVYRVAPIDASETLIGKYVAYLLIGGVIGAVGLWTGRITI